MQAKMGLRRLIVVSGVFLKPLLDQYGEKRSRESRDEAHKPQEIAGDVGMKAGDFECRTERKRGSDHPVANMISVRLEDSMALQMGRRSQIILLNVCQRCHKKASQD